MTSRKFWIAKPYEELAPLKQPKTQRRRLPSEVEHRIVEMRKAGQTKESIMAALGVGSTTITRVCRKHLSDFDRAEIRSSIQHSRTYCDNAPARLRRQEILELRLQGLPFAKIAEKLGLAVASVGAICKELDYLEEEIAASNAASSRFKRGHDDRRQKRAI